MRLNGFHSLDNEMDLPLSHAQWLGGSQEDDAEKTIAAIKSIDVDWMIVDNYAIDECWHKIRPHVKRIFVIDDLGDRKHDCDILLIRIWVLIKKNTQKWSLRIVRFC